MADDLYPIALLTEEMNSEDTEVRINAMRQLRKVAAALGPERTRKELISFLQAQVEDDDEVLLVMAEELGGFIDLVGGPAQAVCLMSLLGALATVEETVVREKAVESANLVIAGLDSAAVVEHVVPVIKRLSQGDWFTARVSACGLFAVSYARLTHADSKAELRTYFNQLCNDETPMVKRAASKAIGQLARAASAEKDVVTGELLPLFDALAKDDQDSVRLLAIENCTAFAGILSLPDNERVILPLAQACAGDRSWRVRNNVAREFAPLARSLGPEAAKAHLLPALATLLRDPEAEVRASAVKNAAAFVDIAGGDRFLVELLPPLRELVADPAQLVRTATAEALMDVAARLPAEHATAHVVPLVMTALRDEAPEVRLKVLEALSKIVEVLPPGFLSGTLLPALVALANDPLWRVREKVIDQLPLLAMHLGAPAFEEHLLPRYLHTYQDQVNAVRMAATRTLRPLAMQLGGAWVREKLVPRLRDLYTQREASYLQRITVLYGVRNLAAPLVSVPGSSAAALAAVPGSVGTAEGAAEAREAANDALDLLLNGLHDAVPNVRFIAAQILRDALAAHAFAPSRISAEIKPALTAVQSDSDQDVRFFVGEALKQC